MEIILEKYKRLRPLIKDGDIILFHGTSIMARIIQWCDKSYYNHVGVVVEKLGAFYIVDANASGVQADRLSWRIKKYKRGTFIIIQPTVTDYIVEDELKSLLRRVDVKWVKYDFWNGFKELVNRKFNWNLKITYNDDADICSDTTANYTMSLQMVLIEKFIKLRIAFPQDYIRYRNLDHTKIIN